MRTRGGSKLLGHLIVGLCIVSSLACPGKRAGYELHAANLPIGTESASVALTVVVPEGDWELTIEGVGRRDVIIREPSPSIEEDDSDCIGECSRPDFVLHCPRGRCPFVFDVSKRGDSSLSAGILFSVSDDEGCGDPDPNYVPFEERSRLFQVTFDVHDVVLRPDAGVLDGGFHADAGLRGDASTPAAVGSGLDAGIRMDAGR